MKHRFGSAIAAVALLSTAAVGAGLSQKPVLDAYLVAAKAESAGFSSFSAERGKAFFLKKFDVSAEAPSCSSCHTTDPKRPGQTRAGKEIAPMAVSVTPDRFTDTEKVEKWFTRNCQTVVGRACTAAEKGDFIAFMMAQ